jgi:protein-tyrosine phosphatase
MISVLFVCLGNICRSPAAEGIMRSMVKANADLINPAEVLIESCGLGDWHLGSLPDERMREAAKNRGYTLSSKAQEINASFFDSFNLILAADNKVMHELYRLASTPEYKAKIHLITYFSTFFKNQEIPDPYYQGKAGFELVLDMLEDSCVGILEHLETLEAGHK